MKRVKLPGRNIKSKRVIRLEVPQTATKYLSVIREYLYA